MSQRKSRFAATLGFCGLSLLSMAGGCRQAEQHDHHQYQHHHNHDHHHGHGHHIAADAFEVEESARPAVDAEREGVTVDGTPIVGNRLKGHPYDGSPNLEDKPLPPKVPASESIFDRGIDDDSESVSGFDRPNRDSNSSQPELGERSESPRTTSAPIERRIPTGKLPEPTRPAAPPTPQFIKNPKPEDTIVLDLQDEPSSDSGKSLKQQPVKSNQSPSRTAPKPFELFDNDANKPIDVELFKPSAVSAKPQRGTKDSGKRKSPPELIIEDGFVPTKPTPK